MSDEIKPCQNCNYSESKLWAYNSLPWWYRRCENCHFTTEYADSPAGANLNWNRRATVSKETAQLLAVELRLWREGYISRIVGEPSPSQALAHFEAETKNNS